MSDIVVKAENIGKKYLISHQGVQGEYSTMRDLIAGGVKKVFRSINPKREAINGSQGIEEFWALKNVDFEIKQGDVVGVVGRNGAGKSTLLKVLSRITDSTEGRLTIKGRIASLLEVGTGFHPELTGRENIFLNGAILGMKQSEIKLKFDEIVDFSGVERFLDTPVKRYSSGMYMRLAFSVAANLESEILVIDEVLAVGDAEFQKKCLGKMGDVSKQEGRTILFVSHNMAAIKSLCNNAFLLENGVVNHTGTADEVLRIYQKRGLSAMANNNDLSVAKRLGGEVVKFMSCNFKNSSDELVSVVAVGDTLVVEIMIQVSEANVKNLRFAVSIFDPETNRLVTELNTYYGYNQVINFTKAGQYKLMFSWPDLPLSPKDYNITFICTSGLELMDWVKDSMVLTVTEGQFYVTNQMPLPGHYPDFFPKFEVKFS